MKLFLIDLVINSSIFSFNWPLSVFIWFTVVSNLVNVVSSTSVFFLGGTVWYEWSIFTSWSICKTSIWLSVSWSWAVHQCQLFGCCPISSFPPCPPLLTCPLGLPSWVWWLATVACNENASSDQVDGHPSCPDVHLLYGLLTSTPKIFFLTSSTKIWKTIIFSEQLKNPKVKVNLFLFVLYFHKR